MTHFRLVNQLFENPAFLIDPDSLGYCVRDIINMNWWNTSGVLLGYAKNKRVMGPFTDDQKRIAVQLKEYYYVRRIRLANKAAFEQEIRDYCLGRAARVEQLNLFSYELRANPSQFFHTPDGRMTWVDCTSRATYAAKYVFQNGYIDFDGAARFLGASDIIDTIRAGQCFDIGVTHLFVDGENTVKAEIFTQKHEQLTVSQWIERLSVQVIPERQWLLDAIGHVRTDPYKKHEASLVEVGQAPGVNECLYGYSTLATFKGDEFSSAASRARNASAASRASRASDASHVSAASNAGFNVFQGDSWERCPTAIKRPEGLAYPPVFRKNIFALAGNWKIDAEVVKHAKLGWIDVFSGHGASPLYAKRHGIRYLGFDTNARAFDKYLNFINAQLKEVPGPPVEVRLHDSTVFLPELTGQFDLCYTSPPYFNFEEYGGNTAHYDGCETYDDYHKKITVPVFNNVSQYLVPGGLLALQTESDKTKQRQWIEVISSLGFEFIDRRVTGREDAKYSSMAKRDQSLALFIRR